MHNTFAIVLICVASACSEQQINAGLHGKSIQTTVDSELAKYYIENYLTHQQTIPAYDSTIKQILKDYTDQIPDRSILQDLTHHFISFDPDVDLITISAANTMSMLLENRKIR